MMRKILAAMAAVSLATASAGAPLVRSPPQAAQTSSGAYESIIDFCRNAHAAWMKGDKSVLEQGMAKLDPTTQKTVAVICMAYGDGFVDGAVRQNFT